MIPLVSTIPRGHMADSKKGRRKSLEDERRALAAAAIDPRSAASGEGLRAALRSRYALVVAGAANVIKQNGLV